MKNGCLIVILVFLGLFLMCTIKVADKLDNLKPCPSVPLPEPKPIPIIKVPPVDSVETQKEQKPDVEPIDESLPQPLPEPNKIPVVKKEVENTPQQYGHWEKRIGKRGLFGLRTYEYKVWVNDGSKSTECKDGSCQ